MAASHRPRRQQVEEDLLRELIPGLVSTLKSMAQISVVKNTSEEAIINEILSRLNKQNVNYIPVNTIQRYQEFFDLVSDIFNSSTIQTRFETLQTWCYQEKHFLSKKQRQDLAILEYIEMVLNSDKQDIHQYLAHRVQIYLNTFEEMLQKLKDICNQAQQILDEDPALKLKVQALSNSLVKIIEILQLPHKKDSQYEKAVHATMKVPCEQTHIEFFQTLHEITNLTTYDARFQQLIDKDFSKLKSRLDDLLKTQQPTKLVQKIVRIKDKIAYLKVKSEELKKYNFEGLNNLYTGLSVQVEFLEQRALKEKKYLFGFLHFFDRFTKAKNDPAVEDGINKPKNEP